MLLRGLLNLRISLCSAEVRQLHHITRVSLLKHIEYLRMKEQFSFTRKPLGPVDSCCSFILGEGLLVNQQILFLDALSLRNTSGKSMNHIKELKRTKILKSGGFTLQSDKLLLQQYERLLRKAEVEEAALKVELFSEEKTDIITCSSRREKWFLLKRQLVGFWLLQELSDGDRRLPTEVYARLATLLFSGNFSKEDDAVILAWVEEHGATKWSHLAQRLGRCYPKAGDGVRQRHGQLVRQLQGRKTGAFSDEEVARLTHLVLKQNRNITEKCQSSVIDWDVIADAMKRSSASVNKLYNTVVLPTLKRHQADTLEVDVRGDLLRKLKEKGSNYYIEINFQELAEMPEFRGHTGRSLGILYERILKSVARNSMKSSREITVDQVLEYWATSKRQLKPISLKRREEIIVSTFEKAMGGLPAAILEQNKDKLKPKSQDQKRKSRGDIE